ncbi:hypothetical protein C8Q80DRAFT_1211892 [Daedaleopsis nitida]|nr:hypothetical protein C8Q80DRAFT_1211892 [Daedaleopsis nitida]
MWERAGIVPASTTSNLEFLLLDVCKAVFAVAALWLHAQPKRIAHWAFWAGPCRDTTALLVDNYVREYISTRCEHVPLSLTNA